MIARLFTFILIAISFVLIPTQLFAQSTLSVNINPQYPRPGENIVISLDSYFNNIESSLIRWEKDGQLLREGVGLTQITFQTDQDAQLAVRVETSAGLITQAIPITVSEVDVLWQVSNSYVPPFYKGKALPTEESSAITAVAIPDRSDRGSLIYRWQKNGVNVAGEGGFGKPAFSFSTSVFDDGNFLRANVSDTSGSFSLSGSNSLNYVKPRVIFYEHDSRFGNLLGKVVKNNHTVSGDSITLVAIPYFLSTTNILDDVIEMKWSVRGQEVQNNSVKNRVSVAVNPGQSGIIPISLLIEHTARMFENGTINLNLNF